jgi:Protein of unknown function (DUF3105)
VKLATRDPGEATVAAGRSRRSTVTRVLEGVGIGIAALAVAFLAIALLSGFFTSQDQPGFTGADTGPGIAFRDLGHVHLQPGQPDPAYNSNPPTSGAHVPDIPTSNGAELTNDQLLEVLELGDVVIMYGSPTPPPGLEALARQVAPPFNPALVATGAQLIFARRPGAKGLIGLAWAHMIRTTSVADPMLKVFAQYWIGRGAPRG